MTRSTHPHRPQPYPIDRATDTVSTAALLAGSDSLAQPHPIDRAADTVDEFCEALRIGRTMFYAEVAAGRIHPVKAGRRTLVPRSEREAWLRRLRGEAV